MEYLKQHYVNSLYENNSCHSDSENGVSDVPTLGRAPFNLDELKVIVTHNLTRLLNAAISQLAQLAMQLAVSAQHQGTGSLGAFGGGSVQAEKLGNLQLLIISDVIRQMHMTRCTYTNSCIMLL